MAAQPDPGDVHGQRARIKESPKVHQPPPAYRDPWDITVPASTAPRHLSSIPFSEERKEERKGAT
jgi:hypothetical protein